MAISASVSVPYTVRDTRRTCPSARKPAWTRIAHLPGATSRFEPSFDLEFSLVAI